MQQLIIIYTRLLYYLCTAFSTDIYLAHYWPITNGDMNDTIGNAHMTQGSNTAFTTDRFGEANSALSLNGGYTNLPSQIYFDTAQFSVSVWIYYLNSGFWARVVDVGDGCHINQIDLAQQASLTNLPYLELYNETRLIFGLQSKIVLQNHTWQFLAATFDGSYTNLYINGTLTGTSSNKKFTPRSLKRKHNYIGKSNCNGNDNSYSHLDDLRFFNTSLSEEQIIELMSYVNPTTTTYSITTTNNTSICF